MNLTLKPAFGLSGSALKVIAMISMVIDHIALYLMEYGTYFPELYIFHDLQRTEEFPIPYEVMCLLDTFFPEVYTRSLLSLNFPEPVHSD